MEEKEKFNQTAYINEYKKKNYKRLGIQIPLKETDVLAKLETVKNKNAYIINLIKQDLSKK